MLKKILWLPFLLLFTSSVKCQETDSVFISRFFAEIMTNGKAYDNLEKLCKKIGPRLSGSSNAERAVELTAQLLKEAGADTVYLQSCMVPHWVRGEKESASLTLADGKKRLLKMCALGNSVGTPVGGLLANVIEVHSLEELDKMGAAKIKGRIVFFNKPMNPLYVRTFKAYGECGVIRWGGPTLAAKYGAVGAVVRSLASNDDDYPHTGVTEYNDSFPKIPAIAISTHDANFLSESLKKNSDLKMQISTTCKMLPDVQSFNVIGEIRGTEQPDEYITVGGHLDSWDLAEGAHDDGTGCTQSIEILRSIKAMGYRTKRTLRVVMFMNEENGGRGGEAYFNEAKAKNEHHLFAIESDAGGFTPRGFATGVTDSQFQKLLSWKPIFDLYDINQISNDGSGSDIYHLKNIGTAVAELRPDSQRYFDVHHASTDRFESVSKRELHLGAFAMGALILLVDKYGL
jgi:hypothetical protein